MYLGEDDRKEIRGYLDSLDEIATGWRTWREKTADLEVRGMPVQLVILLDELGDVSTCPECPRLLHEDWDFCQRHGVVVARCSCGEAYHVDSYAELALGAGHHGDPTPVNGLVVRVCGKCGSSVSVSVEVST